MIDLDAALAGLNFWHWWVLGAAFLAVEILIPGVFFLWLAIAAGVTGLLAWILPELNWQAEILFFALLSVVSALLGRRLYGRGNASDHPTLNRRAAQYVGQVFTLDSAIVNGNGRLRVADTSWKVTGPDLPAASRVRVIGAEGAALRVEAAEPGTIEPGSGPGSGPEPAP